MTIYDTLRGYCHSHKRNVAKNEQNAFRYKSCQLEIWTLLLG